MIDAHMIVAREIALHFPRFAQVKAVLSFRHHFRQGKYAIVCTVEEDLAHLGTRDPVEPGASQLERQHVTKHCLIAPGSNQRPFVVFGHTEYLHLLLLSAIIGQHIAFQRAEAIGLLVRLVERRVAAVFQRYPSLIVDMLSGIGNGVGMVFLPVAIVDDFHLGGNVVIA